MKICSYFRHDRSFFLTTLSIVRTIRYPGTWT